MDAGPRQPVAQNFRENYLLDPVLAGEVALPAGDVGEPFVDADDIAEAAVKAVLDGRNASVADGVQRALGRPPRDFAAYARAAAAAGIWDPGRPSTPPDRHAAERSDS